MAPPRDLRDWISLLEREAELRRVPAEVDPHLEITEIVDRVVKNGGPALLFENPKSQHPLLINQFGTERRMCLAFDAPSLDDVGRRLGDVLEMQPPQGLAEKVRGLKKLKSIADSQPKTVRSGPVQEVVLQGDEVDLALAPDGEDHIGRGHQNAGHERPPLTHARGAQGVEQHHRYDHFEHDRHHVGPDQSL